MPQHDKRETNEPTIGISSMDTRNGRRLFVWDKSQGKSLGTMTWQKLFLG